MDTHQSANDFHQPMYDCLLYYVRGNTLSYPGEYNTNKYDLNSYAFTHQIIPYCFRPLEKPQHHSLDFPSTLHSHFTFHQLRMINVTSEQLYLWAIPIDLAEQYQIYLDGNDSLAQSMFYNCTQGCFGPWCQYSFGFKDMSLLFADIVQNTFELKKQYYDLMVEPSMIFSNLSCYVHLECDRGRAFPACLDWREICDGKVDCIDGGSDEEGCDQLEINECNEKEYRCHNGQCIPEEYLWDMSHNPECLDGTDETAFSDYTAFCPYDPSFRCEDVMLRPRNSLKDADIVCGDGSYNTYTTPCVNKRDLLLKKAMIQSTSAISITCRDTMACLTGLDDCEKRLDRLDHCPELFQFPGVPILFGHVTFVYRKHSFDFSDGWNIILPTYVCYDLTLCSLPSIVNVGNYSACWPMELLDQIFTTNRYSISWNLLISEVKNIFHGCSAVPGGYCHHNDSLYTCNFMTKCISKHRVLDGIEDCLFKDDEEDVDSCALNHTKHRLSCNQKCFSPLMIRDHIDHCTSNEDEQSPYITKVQNEISFQTTCDGYVELTPPISIDGQGYTDESECDFWPCNNSYTRCNGIWNCLNGADEMNCPPSTCPPLRKMCFFIPPPNKLAICQNIDQMSDTYVNCSTALDPRQLCYKMNDYFSSPPISLIKDSELVQTDDLCIKQPQCISRSDEQFCSPVNRLCTLEYQPSQKEMARFLCDFDNSTKLKFIPFSVKNVPIYPIDTSSWTMTSESVSIEENLSIPEKRQSWYDRRELAWIWRCNRGLPILVQLENGTYERQCICPPSYYGDLCQYQNQRVSLTLQVRVSSDWRTTFAIILTLIDDEEQSIHSYDQVDYLAIRDCKMKFNLYLLYSTRPKNISKNSSVRIDVFNKQSLAYIASWSFPILFPFLPVHRMALQIIIPVERMKTCSLDCGAHGHCSKYQNMERYFCQCDAGWSGSQCQNQHRCNCANDSLCFASSICLCPEGKFGSRCFLKRKLCKSNLCLNDGTCILSDTSVSQDKTMCLCPNGFSGSRCQVKHIEMKIKFFKVTIPSLLWIHFIKVDDEQLLKPHTRVTLFKKIRIYEDSVIIYQNFPFNIAFAELHHHYYLIVLQQKRVISGIISTDVNPSHKCLSINELFNESFVKLHIIRRIKYYHLPCEQHPNLTCFYDDTQMCLCNLLLHANCFQFNHSMIYDCQGVNHCENGGRCFQDDPTCPKTSGCFCPECFHGSRCQFSSKGFSLTLDLILSYHILPNVKLTDQPLATQMSAAITMIIVCIGLLSSLLSIITFQSKNSRHVGCGIYILMSSITSLITMILLTYKFWFLVSSQMMRIVDRSLLQLNCRSTDFVLRVFLITGDWLNACVSVERAVTVAKGPLFDKRKSRQAAKWMLLFIVLITTLTSIQDPLNRDLTNDEDEQRILCTTKYSSFFQIFNSTMILFHSLFPFAINVLSAFTIIILAARQKSKARIQKPLDKNLLKQYHQQLRRQFRQNLRIQFQEHKHLLISSCILVLLALPRLIIAFLSGCMKSVRDPWLFLVGYFISFIPSALIFAVFILPSTAYKKEFKKAIKSLQRKFHCM